MLGMDEHFLPPDPSLTDDAAPGARPDRSSIVPLRARHDGWTPDRQIAFLTALGQTACVDAACRHVGLSRASAYALRGHAYAQPFRRAWE